MDKYGRPLEKESSVNDLKRYYRMASPDADATKDGENAQGEDNERSEGEGEEEDGESEEEEDEAPTKSFMDLARGEVLLESSDEEDQDEAAVSEAESDSSSAAGSVALGPSRRRRQPSRSPSIDLSETERPLFPDEDEEDGELDPEDEEAGAEPTKRVALVNMDWDNLRASDLYRVLASSLSSTATAVQPAIQPKASGSSTKFDQEGNEVGPYKPSAKLSIAPGRLLHLRVYPSTFGRERMEREAIEGPPVEVLRTKGAESDDDEEDGVLRLGRKNKGKARERRRRGGEDEDDEEEEEYTAKDLIDDQVEENADDYDTEALRKYQLERLR